MPLPQKLRDALSQNNGTITTAEANAAGISNERLRLLVRASELERVAHGVYITPDELLDRMYAEQLRKPKIVYSHESALFLHGLIDRDPVSYTVTVPTGYNALRLRQHGLNVFSVKNELHGVGLTQARTIFGNTVTVYNPERTVCDCLRSRSKMDLSLVTEAVKRYTQRSDKNLNTLMKMAETFRVTKPLRAYLEVLL